MLSAAKRRQARRTPQESLPCSTRCLPRAKPNGSAWQLFWAAASRKDAALKSGATQISVGIRSGGCSRAVQRRQAAARHRNRGMMGSIEADGVVMPSTFAGHGMPCPYQSISALVRKRFCLPQRKPLPNHLGCNARTVLLRTAGLRYGAGRLLPAAHLETLDEEAFRVGGFHAACGDVPARGIRRASRRALLSPFGGRS
jgi:hypothetical protein